MIRAFLDANVILEVLLKRREYEAAANILKSGERHHINIYTSSSVIGFIAYWLIKEAGTKKTKDILTGLLGLIRIADISHEQLLLSLAADFKDIEDGIQYYTALQHKLDYFITLNKGDFRKAKGEVQIAAPAEVLKILTG
ncbi:MAG: PIN domain-containing protein [Chitinophagales bacterium]|nr:PIN domain-containing protein [Chitinophagales bacterium]